MGPLLSWPDACVSDLSGRDHEESPHRYSHARHRVPHAGHPTHHLDNLQLLCLGCNSTKGNRTKPEWRAAQLRGGKERP